MNEENRRPPSGVMRMMLRLDDFTSSHWGTMGLTLLALMLAFTDSTMGLIGAAAVLIGWGAVVFAVKRYEREKKRS